MSLLFQYTPLGYKGDPGTWHIMKKVISLANNHGMNNRDINMMKIGQESWATDCNDSFLPHWYLLTTTIIIVSGMASVCQSSIRIIISFNLPNKTVVWSLISTSEEQRKWISNILFNLFTQGLKTKKEWWLN